MTTQDIAYVEKARTGGLAVEMETGRWKKIREDRRRCAHCNARKGDAEHARDRCREFDEERDGVKLKLREIGLVDESPWGVIIKGGVKFRAGREGTLEKRQAALRALNGFFRKVDEKKREKLEKGSRGDSAPSCAESGGAERVRKQVEEERPKDGMQQAEDGGRVMHYAHSDHSRGGGFSAAMGRREGRAFCGSQETQRKTRQSARREMKRKKRKRASRAGAAEGASGGGVEAK